MCFLYSHRDLVIEQSLAPEINDPGPRVSELLAERMALMADKVSPKQAFLFFTISVPASTLERRERSAFSKEGRGLILLFLYSFLKKRVAGEMDKNGSCPPLHLERMLFGGFGLHSTSDIPILYIYIFFFFFL